MNDTTKCISTPVTLCARCDWAEQIIAHGVELMTLEQLSQWEGVGAWQRAAPDTEQIPIGSKVTTRREYPGIVFNGVTYGDLAKGAQGKAVGHTEDGRVMVSFDGVIHTFNCPEALLWEPPAPVTDQNTDWFTLAASRGEEIRRLREKNKELQAKLEDLHAKYEASQNELHRLGQGARPT